MSSAHERAAAEILDESLRAAGMFDRFASHHEGWAVIREEVDELWDEVKKRQTLRDPEALRREAIQVGAMAIRFLVDLCQGEES